ncbi:hypothetical protein CBS101457_004550 [Exobasidium rhododendri]|nr:hypothetical protein CBS101457_004550 [Exobasidium rhododendri]
MASLLRAAQSPDTASRHQSPMSVHSIVESDSLSKTAQSRPKKRRTSSVQEPLQGSALEAVRRTHGAKMQPPRRSETPTDYMSRIHHNPADAKQIPLENPLPGVLTSGLYQSTPLLMSLTKAPSPSYDEPKKSQRSATPSRTYHRSDDWDQQPQPPPPSSTSLHLHQNQQHFPQQTSPQRQRLHLSAYSPTSGQVFNYPHLSPTAPEQGSAPYSFSHEESSSHSPRYQVQSNSSKISSSSKQRVPPVSTSHSVSTNVLGKRPSEANQEHWSRQLASRAAREEQIWTESTEVERSDCIRNNILLAREDVLHIRDPRWSSRSSMVTTVRCMYANIAQKSYGSEKRFLCPPPVVKISGPMRPCKWASVRVISGESPTPSSISSRTIPLTGVSGEEEAVIDANREAKFGKLHVGSLSDARGKTFRLQINLLRADQRDQRDDDGNRIGLVSSEKSMQYSSTVLPGNAWSTFHSSPISVISKPARKSLRTRATSPAIASGSTVCLYNRLNSQTVRTKYLAVETLPLDKSRVDLCKLVARQDGWEGFSIELLAKPLDDPAVQRCIERDLPWDDWSITYGSIICLREITTNVCSDPMLICKVEKGKVEFSSLLANAADGRVRFHIVAEDQEGAKRILYSGVKDRSERRGHQDVKKAEVIGTPMIKRDDSEESGNDESSPAFHPFKSQDVPHDSLGTTSSILVEPSGSVGGGVIQMQKVTLMHISPQSCSDSNDTLECDLRSPRAYLSSTAYEGLPEDTTLKAFARSMERLNLRYRAVTEENESRIPEEEEELLWNLNKRNESPMPQQTSGVTPCPVGYVRPCRDDRSSFTKGEESQTDVLEDPFCWTIVTISQTERSFIEANASQSKSYPLLPTSTLPITPYPTMTSRPSYSTRNHSVAATIYDFYYQSHQDENVRGVSTTISVNHVWASTDSNTSHRAHEIWLGHSGPLPYESTSAGPNTSDVTFQLPSIDHLTALHREFHGSVDVTQEQGDVHIYLPILFIRASQGISFISTHSLQGFIRKEAESMDDTLSPHCWTFSLV